MGKMQLKFWKIRDRRHIPIKLLRLGFGSRLIFQDQDRNVTLLPKPLNVIFTDTFQYSILHKFLLFKSMKKFFLKQILTKLQARVILQGHSQIFASRNILLLKLHPLKVSKLKPQGSVFVKQADHSALGKLVSSLVKGVYIVISSCCGN